MVSNLRLSLDLSPPTVPRSSDNPDFLTRFRIFEKIDFEELKKIDDFISRLEDEVNKIKAFKRELPLSFLLLTKAIDKLKEEEATKLGEQRKESKFDEIAGANSGNDHQFEMRSWMSSVQLWSPRDEDGEWQTSNYRGGAGAVLSFTECPRMSPEGVEPGSNKDRTGGIFGSSAGSINRKLPYQTAKKQRRCWSPELHRRFVDALERLGGCQVATPKQIRELMQVDGLTNDEVKSHLQKYRVHVRKLPAASRNTPSSSNDIATSRDHGLKLGCSLMGLLHSSSPKGPLHLGSSGKCNSTSIEDHDDDDDNNNDSNSNSDGYSWNV